MTITRILRRVHHVFSALQGLLRMEVRGASRLGFGLFVCAVMALVFGRFVLRIEAPVGGRAQENVLLAMAFLYVIPLLAGAFEDGRGHGSFRALQAAPVSKPQVFAAKILGPVIMAAIAVAVTGAVDVAIALAAPAPSSGGLGDGLEWRGLTGMILGLGTLAVFGTLLAGIVTRHAFGACAAGGLLAAVPVALTASSEQTIFSDVVLTSMHGLTLGSGNFGVAASVVLMIIGVLFPLRGLAARHGVLRGGLLGAGTVGLFAVPLGLRMVETSLLPRAAFDIPNGKVWNVDVSPDGSRMALQLYHWQGASQISSLWIVDAETYEVTPLPTPVSGALALMRVDITGANWSADGKQVCGVIFPSSRHFGIDAESGVVKDLSWNEFQRKVINGGWTFERNLPGGGGVARAYRGTHPEYPSVDIVSPGAPVVPKDATHLFFIRDEDHYVHRVDGRTGESTKTGLLVPGRSYLATASPDGEWLLAYRDRRKRELFHVASGRSREVIGDDFVLTDREHPLMVLTMRGGASEWSEVGLDGALPFSPECGACELTDLDGERWIANVKRRNLYVLDAQGKILRTLRELPAPEPRN